MTKLYKVNPAVINYNWQKWLWITVTKVSKNELYNNCSWDVVSEKDMVHGIEGMNGESKVGTS